MIQGWLCRHAKLPRTSSKSMHKKLTVSACVSKIRENRKGEGGTGTTYPSSWLGLPQSHQHSARGWSCSFPYECNHACFHTDSLQLCASDGPYQGSGSYEQMDVLDPALVRQVVWIENRVPLPNEKLEHKILDSQQKMTVDDCSQLAELARIQWIRGAQLKAVCVESSMIALVWKEQDQPRALCWCDCGSPSQEEGYVVPVLLSPSIFTNFTYAKQIRSTFMHRFGSLFWGVWHACIISLVS